MSLFEKSREVGGYEVQGIRLKCQVCGHGEFWRRQGQLNTRAASLFNVDWANPSAQCVVCDRCGYIHWFLPK